MMREYNSDKLMAIAKDARKRILKMNHEANASHTGSSLSIVEILTALYFNVLEVYPENPKDPRRDRFFLSKGHACSALYSILAIKGFYTDEKLAEYSKNGSEFLTHASHLVPGVEFSTGSLGHVLSISVGVAIAAKKTNKSYQVYTLLSDGELDEGSNWEALLFAPKQMLDNLTVIVDYNKIQSLGFTKDILDLEPLSEKFASFGWNVIEIDGHNLSEIIRALTIKEKGNKKPTAIIANTVKGKGISFMENQVKWHYKSPNAQQYKEAIQELDKP